MNMKVKITQVLSLSNSQPLCFVALVSLGNALMFY